MNSILTDKELLRMKLNLALLPFKKSCKNFPSKSVYNYFEKFLIITLVDHLLTQRNVRFYSISVMVYDVMVMILVKMRSMYHKNVNWILVFCRVSYNDLLYYRCGSRVWFLENIIVKNYSLKTINLLVHLQNISSVLKSFKSFSNIEVCMRIQTLPVTKSTCKRSFSSTGRLKA